MTTRLPWICRCGVFNSQARDLCRVCKGTRQETIPSLDLQQDPPEDSSQNSSQLLAAIEETRTYLSTVESDEGVSSALKALEKAADTSAGSDAFHMLINSAMMVLGIRVNMGVCALETVVARLRTIGDQK